MNLILLAIAINSSFTTEVSLTKLQEALFARDQKSVIQLSRSEGLINNVGEIGIPPLQIAVATGNLDAVTVLVSSGASLATKDWKGNTVAHVLCGARSSSKLNKSVWADHLGMASMPEASRLVLLLELKRKGLPIKEKNFEGATPLHFASKALSVSLCATLCELGASPNDRDNNWQTALHWLVARGPMYSFEGGDLEDDAALIARLLILYGTALDARDRENKSPFDLARHNRRTKVLMVLESARRRMKR